MSFRNNRLNFPPDLNPAQHISFPVDFQADHDALPISEQLYNWYLSMHEHQKKICFQKKSTQYLLMLCGDYALHSIETQGRKARERSTVRIENELEDALVWYKSIYRLLQQWSTLDDVEVLSAWRDFQKAIHDIFRSQPFGVESFSVTKRKNHIQEGRQSIYVEYSIQIVRDNLDEVVGTSLPYILGFEEDFRKVLKLKGNQAQSFADLLDWVMDRTELHSKLYRLCERALRRLCGKAALLPSSYYLKEGDLAKTHAYPSCGGGFADVFEGVWKEQRVALKELRHFGVVDMKKLQKSFFKEVVIWKRLSHPNIVPFFGIARGKTPSLCMVSSWMENGNLAVYLKRQPGANRLDLVADIARGLKYLHDLQIVHGDVKSGNVLISFDNRARLADFGLASVTHESRAACADTTTTASVGSIRWMAPEILHPTEPDTGRATAESDIYALAMTMYEAFTSRLPFFDCPRDATVVINVTLGIRPERPGQESAYLGLSDKIWETMEMCWQTEKSLRPSLTTILECLEDERLHYITPSSVISNLFSYNSRHSQHWNLDSDSDSDDEGDDARYRDILAPTDNQANAFFDIERAIQQEPMYSHIEPEGTLLKVMNVDLPEDENAGDNGLKYNARPPVVDDVENEALHLEL